MLSVNETVHQVKDYSNEGPLSILVANNEFLSKNVEEKTHHVEDFVKLCGIIPAKNMSNEELAENIIKNALLVEFGEDLLKEAHVVDVIREAIMADDYLNSRVMSFANRHCKQKELDKTLIN